MIALLAVLALLMLLLPLSEPQPETPLLDGHPPRDVILLLAYPRRTGR